MNFVKEIKIGKSIMREDNDEVEEMEIVKDVMGEWRNEEWSFKNLEVKWNWIEWFEKFVK